jgi:hypothetical protein
MTINTVYTAPDTKLLSRNATIVTSQGYIGAEGCQVVFTPAEGDWPDMITIDGAMYRADDFTPDSGKLIEDGKVACSILAYNHSGWKLSF